MGWFSWWHSDKDDPTKSLSPDLKDFLRDQQPRPYAPAEAPVPVPVDNAETPPPTLPDTNKEYQDRPLPRESLFQDGRYKDLWKTYVPQEQITIVTSSPLDRIITAKKDRRELIQRAAMENCVFEDDLRQNCLTAGSAAARARARMTMCRQETKAFNRCFQLQAKFLQALGYLTSVNTTDEEEERIQMHADKLYHRMMDYEASVAEAKLNDDPIPPLSSVFDPTRPAPSIEQLGLPQTLQKKLNQPLHELPPHERELAVRAALQESRMSQLYASDFQSFALDMTDKKQERQQWLIKQFGEPIGKFIIPDGPKQSDQRTHPIDDLKRQLLEGDSHKPSQEKVSTPSSEGTPPKP